MRLPSFDVVLGLTTGAIYILIDGAAGDAVEAGDEEAGADARRPRLDAGDNAFDTVPTRRAVVEFLEPAQLLASFRSFEIGRALLQRDDMFAQGGGRRHAQRVVQL